MGDLTFEQRTQPVSLIDEDSGFAVEVKDVAGEKRLLTDSAITSVNVPLGKDPLPDTYFTVTNAGAISDTVRVEIAGTSNDSSSPDRDLPAVDVTSTLTATEAGDEKALAELIVSDLNADTDFQDAFLEAAVIAQSSSDNERAIVWITSTEFSLGSEFHERPNAGDVTVSVTGTTTVQIDSDLQKLVSRPKEVSLSRDPLNPHRLGVQAISGTIFQRPTEIENVLEEFASNGGTTNLAVNPGGTPDEYLISANAAGGQNKVIRSFKLYGDDGNIKVGEGNFLGLNSALTNGLLIEITKNGTTFTFRNLQSTNDVLSRMASSVPLSEIIGQSGGDFIIGQYDFIDNNQQLTLVAGTTDEIKVTVRDNISSIDDLFFVVEGSLEDA